MATAWSVSLKMIEARGKNVHSQTDRGGRGNGEERQ